MALILPLTTARLQGLWDIGVSLKLMTAVANQIRSSGLSGSSLRAKRLHDQSSIFIPDLRGSRFPGTTGLDRYRLDPRVGFMPPAASTSISKQSGGTGLTNDLPLGQTTSMASGYVTKPITGTRLSCDQ
jgi:hypothetical protein